MPSVQVHYPFLIPQLDRNRAIRVLVPKGYAQHPQRRYPVLYMLDGQNLFDQKTAAFLPWNLRDFMDKLPLKQQAIIIGIDHGGVDRMHEYSPIRKSNSRGEGHVFLDFIVHTLKPFIDHFYRTKPDRENTAIIGASMGGLLALYALQKHANTFGNIGALSPSIWFYPSVLKHVPLFPKSRVYIVGSKTEARYMSSALQAAYWDLQSKGYNDQNLRVVIRDRGRHSETFWRKEVKLLFKWMFPQT